MEQRTVTKGFNSRLHQLMAELGLSQQKVADFASVSQTSVSRWLSGSVPEVENVSLLAKRSGVSLGWLAYGEGSIDPPVLTVEEYVDRTRQRVLPRIHTVLQRLEELLAEPWLNGADTLLIESLRNKFLEREQKLIEIARTFEQLPPDDTSCIEEMLFGKRTLRDDHPVIDFRMQICHLLRIENRHADDAEILERCRSTLKHFRNFRARTADRKRASPAASK